jgi:hypothetical protein
LFSRSEEVDTWAICEVERRSCKEVRWLCVYWRMIDIRALRTGGPVPADEETGNRGVGSREWPIKTVNNHNHKLNIKNSATYPQLDGVGQRNKT